MAAKERAEDRSNKASDFSYAMDKILDEHCRDAGVSTNHVSPALNAAEIVELREFAEKMPYVSRIRRVFNDAAQQAERRLQEGAPEMAHSRNYSSSNDRAQRTVSLSHNDRYTAVFS